MLFDEEPQLPFEPLLAEPSGVLLNRLPVPVVFMEATNPGGKPAGRLRAETNSGHTVDDGLPSASRVVLDNWSSCRLRLQGHQAELLFAWNQNGAGARIQVSQLSVRHMTDELGVAPGDVAQILLAAATAGKYQRHP